MIDKSSRLVGSVLELFVSKKSANKIILDSSGIIGDKFYGKDINRSVLISSIDSYNMAKEKNIELKYGLLGENILIDYNPYNLTTDIFIQIGSVILEITQQCTLCKSLAKIDNKLPKLLKDDRGIFARVIKAGEIRYKDSVYILQTNKLKEKR
jgi:MOSC domain-containing protein YiiM